MGIKTKTDEHSASAAGSRRRFKPKRSGAILREAIFGINDGLVATVGLVSGEVLSNQPHSAIIVAALSASGAATVSMAMGSYLASTSQNDFFKKQIADQASAIVHHPATERHEVEVILTDLGLTPTAIPGVKNRITANYPRWLRFMVREQLGLHEGHWESPIHNAVVMAGAVILGSMPPAVPFLLPVDRIVARNLAWTLSLAGAFTLGYVKGVFTQSPRWFSGLQFTLLAGVSAVVGAGVGILLGRSGL